jgi:hypothetical protein
MTHQCSCGEECPLCLKCDSPKCECFCDLYDDIETRDEENFYWD